MKRYKETAAIPRILSNLINGGVQRTCIAGLMVLTGWLLMSWFVPALEQVTPPSKVTPIENTDSAVKVLSGVTAPALQAKTDFNLVALNFPAPPPLPSQVPIEQTSKSRRGLVEKDQPTSAREPLSASKEGTTDKAQATKKVALMGYNRFRLENIGLNTLNNLTDRTGLNIEFSWPESRSEKASVADILRKCMGVTLGKVRANGTFSARETASVNTSPFVRTIIGNASQNESTTINQWRSLPGQTVRLYPLKTDARLLGGLMTLLAQDLNGLTIKGHYAIDEGGLKIINITVNGQKQQGELIVSPLCY